jgi:hypothetical protein
LREREREREISDTNFLAFLHFFNNPYGVERKRDDLRHNLFSDTIPQQLCLSVGCHSFLAPKQKRRNSSSSCCNNLTVRPEECTLFLLGIFGVFA